MKKLRIFTQKAARSRKRKIFSRPNLLFWLIISVITIAIYSMTPMPAYAAAGKQSSNQNSAKQVSLSTSTKKCPPFVEDCTVPTPVPASCTKTNTAPECLPGISQGSIFSTGVDVNPSSASPAGSKKSPDMNQAFDPTNWIRNPFTNPILFLTDPDLTSSNYLIYQFWIGGVIIVDIFMVLLLILNGIRIILGGSVFRYTLAVETIPRILLAIIVAHLSLLVIAIFIGLCNGLTAGLFNWATSVGPSAPQFTGNMQDPLNAVMRGDKIADPQGVVVRVLNNISFSTTLANPLGNPIDLNIGDVISNSSNLFNFMFEVSISILSIGLFVQLIMRILLINFYTILSAPCIACGALPGQAGQPATRFWLNGFISTVLSQFIQVIALILVQMLLNQLLVYLMNFDAYTFLQTSMTNYMANGISQNSADLGQLNKLSEYTSFLKVAEATLQTYPGNWRMFQCLQIATLVFVIRIPSLLQNSSVHMMQGAGQSFTQAAGTAMSTSISVTQAAAQTGVSIGGEVLSVLGGIAIAAAFL